MYSQPTAKPITIDTTAISFFIGNNSFDILIRCVNQ